jgi:hypothetical protein
MCQGETRQGVLEYGMMSIEMEMAEIAQSRKSTLS